MGRLCVRNRWLAFVLLTGPLYAQCCKNSVAVIGSLSGKAEVHTAGSHERKAAAALDWLTDGDTLEMAARSRAVVILENGHRYELRGGAKITITTHAVPKITGTVRELPPLPPIPQPVPIAAASAPTPAAVRIRGGFEMTGLYPRAGTVALPGKAMFRYDAVPQATGYRMNLEDEAGDVVWNVMTDATNISIPSGTLEAGAHYSWRVRALRSGIEIGAGAEEFTTLSAVDSLKRDQFAEAVLAIGDDQATPALLADVDLRLGLMAEACDELNAAIRRKPEDATLRRLAQPCNDGYYRSTRAY